MHVLVVGSSVIDLFVEPEDNNKFEFFDKKVSFTLGDKIPIKIKRLGIGGNGANVSVGLARLGLRTSFFTYSGKDILSQEIEKTITNEGITLLTDHAGDGHSDLSIIFDFDSDRTIFSHHEYLNHDFSYTDTEEISYIYLTSIGREWTGAYRKVLDFARSRDIPIAFSPGSHQLADMNETFDDVFKYSRMLLMNKDEARKILSHYNMEENITENILKKMKLFGAHIVSITDGSNGSWAIDGFDKMYDLETIPVESHEKTGAGDSYAAGFMAGVLSGQETPEAMRWGLLNAYSVMQKIGAQNGLATRDELNVLLSKHTELQPKDIT